MVKVFRRLRQSLLQERKIGNYLFYAFGEIILVVIGILIALAINNANQRSAERHKERVYLDGLRDEFTTTKNKLNVLIAVNKDNFKGAKTLLSFMHKPLDSISESDFSKILFQTFSSDIALNSNNSLLQEMVSSGSLKDISNDALRVALTNWLSTLVDIARQENELDLQRQKVLDMFRDEDQSLRTIFDQTGVSRDIGLAPVITNNSNLQLLRSNAFENNVLMFLLTSSATEKVHYQPLMQNIQVILEMIENELRK
jgi:hypothetical protein